MKVEEALELNPEIMTQLDREWVYEDVFHNEKVSRKDKLKVLNHISSAQMTNHTIKVGEKVIEPWFLPQAGKDWVLVLPTPSQNRAGAFKTNSKGKEAEEASTKEGTIVSIGNVAFKDADGEPWEGVWPKINERWTFNNSFGFVQHILGIKFIEMDAKDLCSLMPPTVTTEKFYKKNITEITNTPVETGLI